MKDLMNSINVKTVIAPAANANIGTTPLVGAIIDRLGFASLTYLIALGALTDVNAVYSVLLEESDDSGMSGAVAVADADLIGTEALAGFQFDDDNECRKLGYIGSKRYTRLTITPTTTADAGNTPVAVVAVLGHPDIHPTVNPPV
jgi:hypothetical protein